MYLGTFYMIYYLTLSVGLLHIRYPAVSCIPDLKVPPAKHSFLFWPIDRHNHLYAIFMRSSAVVLALVCVLLWLHFGCHTLINPDGYI